MSILILPDAALIGASVRRGEGAAVLVNSDRIAATGAEAVSAAAATGANVTTRRLDGCLLLPGLVSAHSHSFQRDLRGAGERGYAGEGAKDDFWGWRRRMYGLAADAPPRRVRAAARRCFEEMRRAGITSVGEFCYLHHSKAPDAGSEGDYALDREVLAAAEEAGVRIRLLTTSYESSAVPGEADAAVALGDAQRRFDTSGASAFLGAVGALEREVEAAACQSVGLAAHSVRACTRETIGALGAHATTKSDGRRVMHIHLEEQTKELAECAAANGGATPSEVLWRCLGGDMRGVTAVHATHTSDADADRFLAAGGMVCLCPLTEGALGDGVPRWLRRHGLARVCVGSDCNARIDLLEELRALEYAQRVTERRRGVALGAAPFAEEATHNGDLPLALLRAATLNGAESLGFNAGVIEPGRFADFAAVDLHSPSLAEVPDDELLAALVFGCAAEAVVAQTCVGGQWVNHRTFTR